MAYTFRHGERPLDDYTIQRAVGAGGFGEVYYALSDGGREVALKYLKDNPQVELRGVSNCINLKSPHLIAIFDVKKNANGDYFIIMEYVSGPSLRDLLIAEPRGLGAQKAAFFTREIAKGLTYLHDRGIVHRDLKPGNIFYDDGYVKIGDYGLSKFISVSRHSAQTASVGTVHYMAPEIGSGNYSRGIDIYALGVILYEMLMGRVPFEGSTMGEVLMKHLTAQPALDELPHPFARVIRKALEKDPKDRYQTVNEMVDELLGVETIQESLAGFSVQSLDGAVKRGVADTLPSPAPSPNPAIRGYAELAERERAFERPVHNDAAESVPLPAKMAKRMERISRKVEKRLSALSRKANPAGQAQAAGVRARIFHVGGVPGAAAGPWPTNLQQSRRKRAVLALAITIGLAVLLGVLVGNASGNEETGVSASMMCLGLWSGLLLSRKAIAWFGVDAGPVWTQRVIQLLCCAGPLAIGAAPMLDQSRGRSIGVFLGLLLGAVVTKWEKEFEHGANGELRLGAAIRAAIIAVIGTGIFSAIFEGEPEGMLIAAGVAGVVSLCLQPTGWWLYAPIDRVPVAPGAVPPTPDRVQTQEAAVAQSAPLPPPPPFARPLSPGQKMDLGIAPHSIAAPISAGKSRTFPEQGPAAAENRKARWGITRAFWGLVGCVLLIGSIVTGVMPLVEFERTHSDKTALFVVCIAFAAGAYFAMHKMTPLRRGGIWRDTILPLVNVASLFGIGSLILVMIRERGRLEKEEWIAAALGLGFCWMLQRMSKNPNPVPPGVAKHPFLEPPSGAPMPAAAPVSIVDPQPVQVAAASEQG